MTQDITGPINSLEETVMSLKERYDERGLGSLGRALRDALADSSSPNISDLLLSLHRATEQITSAAIAEEVDRLGPITPPALARDLASTGLTSYAQIMSIPVYDFDRQIAPHLRGRLLTRLGTLKLLPRRTTPLELSRHPALPLFLAANRIRTDRRLRVGDRPRRGLAGIFDGNRLVR